MMKKMVWLTDIHLDFLLPDEINEFARTVAAAAPDGLLITGDIATAGIFEPVFSSFARLVGAPVYFVLGNHDCYGGSIAAARASAKSLAGAGGHLHWLSDGMIVPLADGTCLIGHDGWADGRISPGRESAVMLNDYVLIREFAGLGQQARFDLLHKLGDEAAAYLAEVLPRACASARNILLLTHVPPFREACWYKGQITDSDYVPHFTCQAAGDVLRRVMSAHPHCQLTVLCGHTHNEGVARILPNLLVKTGGADYGRPQIQEMIAVG